MSQPKVEFRHVSKKFQTPGGPLEVIRDINLTVNPGEFVSLVGASGCGKTTLLRIMNGLSDATSGSVEIDGRPSSEVKSKMAFVFQHDGLFPWRTVEQNVAFGPEIHRRPTAKTKAVVDAMLRMVGLANFAKSYPHQLSGGMRQRVNIARALAFEPEILLMDEPFAALDAQTRNIMQTELMGIWEKTKKTVMFITHQIDEAVFLSDRVIVLTARPGRIKEDIRIDLPRPRHLKTKWSPEFVAYTDRIWSLIEEEVRYSMKLEAENGQ